MGVELDLEQAALVLAFGALLLRWNRAFNLVSRKDEARLYHRHLLDSLSIVPWLEGARVMDLGTGAGLPGIPLAIACPERRFTLVDRNERKIRLIGQAARDLGLRNVETLCGDVTQVAPQASYDAVVARAVADAGEVWRLARGVLCQNGRLLVMATGQGSGNGATDSVPADAVVMARLRVLIPGLPQPHGLLVLTRRSTATDSTEN